MSDLDEFPSTVMHLKIFVEQRNIFREHGITYMRDCVLVADGKEFPPRDVIINQDGTVKIGPASPLVDGQT